MDNVSTVKRNLIVSYFTFLKLLNVSFFLILLAVNTCPFLHYSPALDLVILKEKYSVPTLER